jgi:uncharacterized HhH-GPD family protein
MEGTLAVTGDPEADHLNNTDPLALLTAMLLDQQVPIEWAFAAPRTLRQRLGPRWGVAAIAAMPVEDLVGVFVAKPALHRYPAVMARRLSALCRVLVGEHGAEVAALWRGVDAAGLYRRLRALPGFGDEKARIFIAVLAKRFDIRPDGWREVCAPFGDERPRTAADVHSPETRAAVRGWKKAQRAAGRAKDDT